MLPSSACEDWGWERGITFHTPQRTLMSLWGRGGGRQQPSALDLPWAMSGAFQRERESVGVAVPQGKNRTFQSPEEAGSVSGRGEGTGKRWETASGMSQGLPFSKRVFLPS